MCAGTLTSGCYGDALTNLVVDAHTVQRLGLIRGEWIAIIADLGRRCMPLALRRAYAMPTSLASPFPVPRPGEGDMARWHDGVDLLQTLLSHPTGKIAGDDDTGSAAVRHLLRGPQRFFGSGFAVHDPSIGLSQPEKRHGQPIVIGEE